MTDPYAALDAEGLNLSRERAARLTGVSIKTVDRAISAGDLASTRIGRKVLIPRESIRAWMSAGYVGGR